MSGRQHALLPYQARWYALGGGGRWRVAEKSRQIGLTWTEAARQAAIAATSRAQGGRRCLYVSTSLLLAREYIDTVALWARAMHRGAVTEQGLTLLRDGEKDILAHEIRFASGFTCTAVASNPAALRGRRGEVCLDEFAHHLHAAELLKAAFALTQWGGTVSVISTHNGARNEFVRIIDQVKRGERAGGCLRVTLDDALADGLYRRICAIARRPWSAEAEAKFRAECLASPGADEEFRCEPAEAGSVFYRRDLLEACARQRLPPLHLARPRDWITRAQEDREADTLRWCESVLKPIITTNAHTSRDRVHRLGIDYGRTVDLSAIWCIEQMQDLSQETPWIVELRNVPRAEQEIIVDYILGRLPRCAGAAIDVSEGGGHALAEALGDRWGRREQAEDGPGLIVGVKLNGPWYEREHHRLRARLEERDLFIVRDEDVLDDLASWRVDESGAVRLGERTKSRRDGGQRHGDTGVALLLAQSLAPEVPQAGKHAEMRPPRGRTKSWP